MTTIRPALCRYTACLLIAVGVQSAARAETYAFLVGVSNYENKADIKSLKFACTDMIAFDGVLRDRGIPLKNIVILHDKQAKPRYKPSRANIMREFHLLLDGLVPEDSLIVALAGHGVELGTPPKDYFLPADADVKNVDTLVNVKDLYQEMEQSQAGRKLLLVDACRNDPESDFSRSLGVALPPPKQMVDGPVPAGAAALFSCKSEQRSYEDPVLHHGIFFHQVIEAWRGQADHDQDGRVTLGELQNFVRRETMSYARVELTKLQTPVFRGDSQTANEWVLSTKRSDPGRPEIGGFLDRGDELRKQRHYDEAEQEYAKAIRADPNSSRAHVAMGKIHHARKQVDMALRAYSKAIAIDPDDASAFVGRAIAHGDSGDLESARVDSDRAIQIAPDLAIAHVVKGAILTRLNRPDEAIAACSRAIELDAKNAKAYFNRGVARELKKDVTGAAQDFLKSAELDPQLKNR